jgi:ATP adenylyltransferase
MPILAGTMVIPEMIPSTYAKIRAELARELRGDERFDIVPVTSDGGAVWLRHGQVATVDAPPGHPVWRAATGMLGVDGAEVVGWAGAPLAGAGSVRPGLTVRVDGKPAGTGWEAIPLDSAREHDAARRALDQMAPWVAP